MIKTPNSLILWVYHGKNMIKSNKKNILLKIKIHKNNTNTFKNMLKSLFLSNQSKRNR